MQVQRIANQNYKQNFNGTPKFKKDVISHLINYNPKDITREEFQEFVHYLAENKINKTFVEPQKFITETERQELQTFRERVHYLAKNKINLTFIC